jgi:hypothetical protein
MLNVRLGVTTTATSSRGNGTGVRGDGDKNRRQDKSRKGKARKGNPARKSQHATHPVYIAYKEAQKAVEKQRKEEAYKGLAFHEVPLYTSYQEKLSAWLQAKSLFRRKSDNAEKVSDNKEVQEEESEESLVPSEGPGSHASDSPSDSSEGHRRKRRRSGPQENPGTKKLSGKYSHPPDDYTGTAEEYRLLDRKERRRLHRPSKMDTIMELEEHRG